MDNVVKSLDKWGSASPKPCNHRDYMVREGGLEPPHLAAQDPKSCVSTSSTTLAIMSV